MDDEDDGGMILDDDNKHARCKYIGRSTTIHGLTEYKCQRTWLDGKIFRLTENSSSTLMFGSVPKGLQRALRAVLRNEVVIGNS